MLFAFHPAVVKPLAHAVPMWTLLLVALLAIVGTVGFGSLVRSQMIAGRSDGLVMDIAATPRTLSHLMHHGLMREPFKAYADGHYPAAPTGFVRNPAQPFIDPGYELLTAYNDGLHRPVIRLLRLNDGKVVHEYRPDITAINAQSTFVSQLIDLRRDRSVERDLMMHPLLMPDGGLVIHDSSPLARVDVCGRPQWMIDGIFHHSVERAADGSLYAVYRYPKSPMNGAGRDFDDEAIAHASADGRLLGLERVADILDRNGLGSLWRSHPYVDDPFHLNEVQPVLASGPFWQRDDLFLSMRNLSLVMLYRPSTGHVLWKQVGPWLMQHDVAIIDDHRISVFDNNWRFAAPEGEVNGVNRVPVYDFRTGQVGYPFAVALSRHHIETRAQGRQRIMPNGDLVIEETERGRLVRMAPDGTIRWVYINADGQHRRLQLRWSRYLDPQADGPAIKAAVNARCS